MAPVEADHGIRKVEWRAHVQWMREHWHPGQHVTILNPTGGGKSVLVISLLKLPAIEHARVLFIDDKGRDKETRGFGIPVAEYPVRYRSKRLHNEEAPEHYRLVVPDWEWSPSGGHRGVDHAREVVARSLDAFYKDGEDPNDVGVSDKAKASVVVIDETFALTDTKPPSLGLAPLIIRGLRKGRYRAQSYVCLSQVPLGMPSDVYTQPTHLYLGQMLDRRYRERLREIGGNSKAIEECVATLDNFEFLFLGNKGRHMHIVKVRR